MTKNLSSAWQRKDKIGGGAKKLADAHAPSALAPTRFTLNHGNEPTAGTDFEPRKWRKKALQKVKPNRRIASPVETWSTFVIVPAWSPR